MAYRDKDLFNKEFIDVWYSNYHKLETLSRERKAAEGIILDKDLEEWIRIQQRIRHMLPVQLEEKLVNLNWSLWEIDHSWTAMFNKLSAFVQSNGHSCLPATNEYETLKDWLIRQILNKKYLAKHQVQQLDSIGIDWEMIISRNHQWEQMYSRLINFHAAFGHCRVPQGWVKDKQLALWVLNQRRLYAKNKLCSVRQQKLNELNFLWNIKEVFDIQWELYFQQLVSFQQVNGHCRVPCNQVILVSWIERQRIAKKKNQLSRQREMQLDAIGFLWSCDGIKQKEWNNRFKEFKAYKGRYGHCLVPVNFPGNKKLGIWVATQRALEAKGKLDSIKKEKLTLVGFVWCRDMREQIQAIFDEQWNGKFEKLKEYKEEYGTCQVSLKINPALQRWTCWQRKQFYKGKLSQQHIDKLNEINFPWSVQDGYWMKMYDALVRFKEQFGHTKVPCQWGQHPQLSAWVYRMKQNKQNLGAQKIEMLNQIGFEWTLQRKTVVKWSAMYRRLIEFRNENGHTRVPVKWEEDQKLGKWVCRMRYEREKLDKERLARLEELEFSWH